MEFDDFKGSYYNLERLLPAQEELKQQFEEQKARRNQDNRREFND